MSASETQIVVYDGKTITGDGNDVVLAGSCVPRNVLHFANAKSLDEGGMA